MNEKKLKTQRRKLRTRSKVKGTKERPRLCVFRSSRYIYAQLINDADRKTIVGVSEKQLGKKTDDSKIEKAKKLGVIIAKAAKGKKITNVVLDRGSYRYHGRVRALAEGAREGGLVF